MTTTLGRVKLHIFKGGVKLASVVEKGSTRRHFDFIKKSLREKFTPHEAERSFRDISMLRSLPRFWQGSATVTFHGGDFVPALFLIPFDISPISTRTGMVKTFFPAAVHKFCLQTRPPLRCVSIVPVLCVCLVLVLEFLESVGRGRGRPYLSFGVTAADGRMASYRGDGESLFQGAAILLRDQNNPKNIIYLIACLLNVSYCIPLLPVLHGMRFS